MKKARQILIGLIILLVLVLIAGQLSIPHYATRAALETTFHDQIQRLREIAYDTKGRWNTSLEGCVSDRKLFDFPAILKAYVEPATTQLIVGNKNFEWDEACSLPDLGFSSTCVSRQWYWNDKGRFSVVTYHSEVIDKNDHSVGINLVVDMSKLKQ
jgi:hypothetical protein